MSPRGVTLTDERVLFWFLSAHAVLGAAILASSAAAKLHFWATAVLGLWFATSKKRQLDIAMLAAYIAGAEVLWRMSQAAIFWETGKYAVTALMVVGLLRSHRSRSIGMPVLYFALLVPGMLVAYEAVFNLATARNVISFNLSGPLCLAAAACFFRQYRMSRSDLGQILVAVVGPLISIGTLTALGTYRSSSIAFRVASNFETSGGFGPNQVSSALSVGVLASFLLLVTLADLRVRRRVMLFAAMVFCAAQSAMTFSRSGLYMASLAVVGASLCLLGDRAGRRLVIGSTLAIALAFGVIAPRLISFTGGALEARFQETNTTGRADLMQDDLQIWFQRPVLGVGVGQASSNRLIRNAGLTHNEWTRLLAEHGVFGLASMLVLLGMMVGNVPRSRGALDKAVVTGLLIWGAAFLAVNEMRIVAPSFLIGLACATFELSTVSQPFEWRRRVVLRP